MQPDSIFKEKLESLRIAAPEQAWSKIEAGLNQKKSSFIWLKVAASLALITIVSYLLWPQQELSLVADNIPVVDQTPDGNKNIPSIDNKVAGLSDPVPPNLPLGKTQNDEHQKISSDNKNKHLSTTVTGELQSSALTDIPLEVEEPSSIEVSNEMTVTAHQSIPTSSPGFKMVIEVNKVNDLYLKKKSTNQATADNQKASGIKRLIDKAQDLKNNQDPLGELRIKKNELFAFNLQSNKKHEREKQIGYE